MRLSFKRILATPVLALALSVGMMATNAVPAHAAGPSAAVATVAGTGTIFPGIDATGVHTNTFTFTSVTITTTGVVNGGVAIQTTSSCGAAGGSILAETIAGGVGTGNWNCTSGALAGRVGGLVYVRVGAVVPVVLTGGLTGALACVFLADQTPPATITSYHLTCAGAGAAAA